MTKRKVSATSLAAYHRADEIIEPHHKLIIGAMRLLKKPIAEEISTRCKLDKNQVSRRMKELVKEGYVTKLETKHDTLAGREAYEYELTEKGLICDIGQIIMPTPTVVEKIRQKKSFQQISNPLLDSVNFKP